MNKSLIIIIILLIIDLPLFIVIGKLMYHGWDNFWDDFKWNLIPDIFSLFSGSFLKDKRGELNSQLYFCVCFIILFLELIVVIEVFFN